jgi:hypothetical protein
LPRSIINPTAVEYFQLRAGHPPGGWGNETVERFIGQFRVKPGGKYRLEVNFTRDGTPLAVTDPHLVVTSSDVWLTREENLEIAIFSIFFVLMEAIGLALVISSAVRYWRN